MSDSPEEPTAVRLKNLIAPTLLVGGVILCVVGLFWGPLVDWAAGAWMMMAGFVATNLSGVGRPVFINVYQEAVVEEQSRNPVDNSGYL